MSTNLISQLVVLIVLACHLDLYAESLIEIVIPDYFEKVKEHQLEQKENSNLIVPEDQKSESEVLDFGLYLNEEDSSELLDRMYFNLGGITVGNGGDAIVCPIMNSNGYKVQLLDYYEAKNLYQLNPERQHNEVDDPIDYVRWVIRSINKKDPERARQYRNWLYHFVRTAVFVEQDGLADINDTAFYIKPYGCELKQLAIQYRHANSSDVNYVISRPLWNQLSPRDQAGLILHEIIYRGFIESSHKNSFYTRFYNSMVTSSRFGQMTLKGYLQRLNNKGVSYNYQNVNIPMTNVEFEFYPGDQIVKNITLDPSQHVRINDLEFLPTSPLRFDRYGRFASKVMQGYDVDFISCSREDNRGHEYSIEVNADNSVNKIKSRDGYLQYCQGQHLRRVKEFVLPRRASRADKVRSVVVGGTIKSEEKLKILENHHNSSVNRDQEHSN